jgi:ankyrin repeat protein
MIIDQLLQKGANVFTTDYNGWNAFMWFADSSDDVDVMTLLLRAAGPAFRPRIAEACAVKKIQSVWRGWKVRRHRVADRRDTWIMRRMMTVQ